MSRFDREAARRRSIRKKNEALQAERDRENAIEEALAGANMRIAELESDRRMLLAFVEDMKAEFTALGILLGGSSQRAADVVDRATKLVAFASGNRSAS